MNIFFDLDGTLVDARKRLYRLYTDFARTVGVTPILETTYFDKKTSGILERDIAAVTFSSKTEEYLEWRKKYIEDASYIKLDTVFLGVNDMLKKLSATRKLFVLTSRVNRARTLDQLENNGLIHFFTEVITTPGSDAVKLKTAGLRDACLRHHLDIQTALIVGDSEVEFGVGKALGIRCVSVLYGLRGEHYFRALGQRTVVKNVHELQTILVQ
jgi:phosphoglycolate phosphatase